MALGLAVLVARLAVLVHSMVSQGVRRKRFRAVVLAAMVLSTANDRVHGAAANDLEFQKTRGSAAPVQHIVMRL